MEAYVQKLGGTTAQADALFSGLNQGATGDLTKAQLASDLQQAQSMGSLRHHHHHGVPSATEVGTTSWSAPSTAMATAQSIRPSSRLS
ncbi:MAG: hypothetical protein ACXWLQ_08165 [Rhizomicrobium sp.]